MNIKTIFRYIILPFFLVGITFQISNADPLQVQVIDSYYHVWAGISDANPSTPVNVTDDQSANVPISADPNFHQSVPWPPIYLEALSQAYEFGVRVSVGSVDVRPGGSPHALARAEAEWTFSPTTAATQITLNMPLDMGVNAYGWYTARLTDLTTGSTLFSIYDCGSQASPCTFPGQSVRYTPGMYLHPGQFDVNFTPGHMYDLDLATYANSNNDRWSYYVEANLQSVAEPATVLLLGFGLVGLVRFRKKK